MADMIGAIDDKSSSSKKMQIGVLDEKLGMDANDKISGIVDNFALSLDTLEEDLNRALQARNTPMLTNDEQIKLDTYLAYANSTLFWMHLKLQGVDVTKHAILSDLGRAKEMLAREKQINESLAAPRLDMAATKRFIAAGIHTRFVDMDGVMVTEQQYKRSLAEAEASKSKEVPAGNADAAVKQAGQQSGGD